MIAGSSCVNIKRNNLRSSHDNNFTSSKFLFMLVHCCLDNSRPSLRQNKYSASFGFRLKIDQHNNFIVFGFFGFVLSLISLAKTLHTFPTLTLVYG